MCSPWSSVTEEHLAAALSVDKGNESVLVSWSFRESPDTFGHHRIAEVKYTLEGQECEVTYAVKCVGRGSGADECHSLLFEKEFGFYEDLAPAINTLLQETGQRSLRIPRCFTHAKTETYEVMVLEDLSTRGFRAADRTKGLDLSHIILAVQELARLHAASYLLQKRSTDKSLTQTYPFLSKEWTKAFKRGGENYEGFLTKYVDIAVAVLEKVGGRGKDIAWLKSIRPKVWTMFLQQLEATPPFMVVCHGDNWSSNILFRYDSLDDPVEAIFVDLQHVRVASPATDLHALLDPNVKSEDRVTNLETLLSSYYSTFSSVLEAGGEKVPFTTASLTTEYRNRFLYGALASIVFTSSAVAGDGKLNPLQENAEASGRAKEDVLALLEEEPHFATRFLATFNELAQAGVIS